MEGLQTIMRGSRHLVRIGVFEISLRVKGVRELRLLLLVIDYTQRLSQAEARASRKFLARVANSVSCKVRMRVNGRVGWEQTKCSAGSKRKCK